MAEQTIAIGSQKKREGRTLYFRLFENASLHKSQGARERHMTEEERNETDREKRQTYLSVYLDR